ncbi:MAG: 4-(cytidine 5'-diphospho)-2-C-methyl-D-erythritol kinase [Capsulimonadales bacterium]|nr:4-(cytidine 5'-diphospho)-2-C-methyl-D-erythritol kinase [Capsulimonadales bacterium]
MTGTFFAEAPAKINLTLDVFPPRPDGFHDLDSVVVKILPVDRLAVSIRESVAGPRITLECPGSDLPSGPENLAYRAADAFLRVVPHPVSVDIRLEKTIPMQAGMGGGSSDAAAVLRLLNDRFPIPPETLLTIGATLGSDVPLFLTTGTVRMEGKGERLTPISDDTSLRGVVVQPGIGVPTGPAYRLLDSLPDRQPGRATARLRDALQRHASVREIGDLMSNDFEAAILPAYPEVDAAHRAVTDAGALRTLLCGSGSAVFGLAEDSDHADDLRQQLLGRFPVVLSVRKWHE